MDVSPLTYLRLKEELADLEVQDGGRHSPGDCRSRDVTAIIIPYRDRRRNLLILLHNLVPFLVRQKVRFTIIVVEQVIPFDS